MAIPLMRLPNHGRAGIILLVRLLCQIRQPNFFIIRTHQPLTITRPQTPNTHTMRLRAARLHAHARLDAGHHVGTGDVAGGTAGKGLGPVGVGTAQVEEVDAGEGDKEAADEG